jgi:hypothetical protein
MVGRPKREYEVKAYLLRLPPALIDRMDVCCSMLDVATRQRLPRNSRLQHALESWCERVEAEHQRTPVPAPTILPVSQEGEISTNPSEPPQHQPEPTKKQLGIPNETLERILSAREQYDKLSLRDFARLLFDRGIYHSRNRKTGQPEVINSGTLKRWLQQGGMT